MEEFNRLFKSAQISLGENSIRRAIETMRQMAEKWSFPGEKVILDNITNDYQLMLDYWRKGYDDPQREVQYRKIMSRLLELLKQMRNKYIQQNTELNRKALHIARDIEALSVSDIRRRLEDYVTDMAMLSLEPEEQRQTKKQALVGQHYDFMSKLFCRIFTMMKWNEDDQLAFQELMLAPTIDGIDAQLIVSAVMLSGIDNSDVRKLKALMYVYKHTTDMYIRQRALVGWVFVYEALCFEDDKKSVEKDIVDTVNTEYDAQQLAELQKQVIFCTSADDDIQKINEEIMPNLLKNQDFNITRNGIVERERDELEDILDPSADERRMEEMEASMKQILDMQKSGSDVFFGGFSQMKRFPFFYKLVNWFYPYTSDHPELQNVKGLENSRNIFERMPSFMSMCNSDKYSFSFGLSMIFDQLTPELREAVASGAGMEFDGAFDGDESTKEMTIRRNYLSDLLRFYRLYPEKHRLFFPFSKDDAFVTEDKVFLKTTFRNHYVEVGHFFKKKGYSDLVEVLLMIMDYTGNNNTEEYLRLACPFEIEDDCAWKARGRIEKYREENESNYWIDSTYIRAEMAEEMFEEAIEHIKDLQEKYPDKASFWNLNLALAYSRLGDFTEALHILYQLSYDEPGNINIQRVLAWSLMGAKKLAEAEKVYESIMASPYCESQDYLNSGYCYWFQHKNARAVELLRQFRKMSGRNIREEFIDDGYIINEFVDKLEQKMMLDLVS